MSLHPTRNYFAEYKRNCSVFVETGTYKGESMIKAREAGFTRIYSCDIVEQPEILFKYDGVGDAHRYIQDSPIWLEWFIPKITEPYMIWLDAHSQQLEGEEDNYPLLRELHTLRESGNRPSVILIDDILMLTHKEVTGWNKQDIESFLDGYTIEYLPNPIRNNILVAYK